jgi:hypothetical protein
MTKEIATGFLWGRPIMRSNTFSPGRLKLTGGLVIDFFDLMQYMALHDVNWRWPAGLD